MIEPGLFDMIMRLRSSGISDTRVLRAMETVRRSDFVPSGLRAQAYDACALPIACGQTLPPPLSIAIMLQTLDVQPTHKVLHIGTGSGYTSAVLAKLCLRVYGVERYRTLVEEAEAAIRPLMHNVVLRQGDGRLGWKGQAPFDRILVSASVRVLPVALQEQLKPNGLIVGVVGDTLIKSSFSRRKLRETKILPLSLSALEPGKSKTM